MYNTRRTIICTTHGEPSKKKKTPALYSALPETVGATRQEEKKGREWQRGKRQCLCQPSRKLFVLWRDKGEVDSLPLITSELFTEREFMRQARVGT